MERSSLYERHVRHDADQLSRPIRAERFALCAPPPRAPVVHDYMALALVTGGSAVMHQKERYELRAGDVYLVPAGAPHGVVSTRSPEAWGVQFCGSCFASELGGLLDPFERAASGASTVVRIPTDRQQHLVQLVEELHRETSRPSAHGELAQKSLLALVLTEIARASSVTRDAGVQSTFVGEALRFVERNCLRPISLRDVAAAVRRSPSHVATTVKAATGKTVVEWIIAGRLAEARTRLLYTDELVDVIAERVGYADPTHFIRLFRRAHGMTPAAWRVRQRAIRASS